MIRVFIGYDRRETIAFHVLAYSIASRSSVPVSITGLHLPQLPITRERDPKQSTDFAFSRFLVPHLCGYKGQAIFMDCDMLCRGDIAELLDAHEENICLGEGAAISVVHHDYTPNPDRKFLGQQQTAYPRKNWSSVMVFDNTRCTVLTPHIVNTMTGLWLHRFEWLEDDEIGRLAPDWNHLVGEYAPNQNAKLVHFTRGGPWFSDFADCEFADEWRAERDAMLVSG